MNDATRTALFLRHRHALERVARRLVKDPEDARDLVQDLVILIIAHPTGPESETSFHAWCRGLMRNIAAHHWRARARRSERTSAVGLEILEFPESSLHGDPELKAGWRERLESLAALDQSSFELLQRRYVLGESASEIAQTLGRSPESIRMKLMRLRVVLREVLGDVYEKSLGSEAQ